MKRKRKTDKRIDLGRLQARFASQVRIWLRVNDLTQGEAARMVGLDRRHLNNLISGRRGGRFQRLLTGHYLKMFVAAGAIRPAALFDGLRFTVRESKMWDALLESEKQPLDIGR